MQGWHGASDEWQGHTDHAGDQDRGDGYDLERHSSGLVVAGVGSFRLAFIALGYRMSLRNESGDEDYEEDWEE